VPDPQDGSVARPVEHAARAPGLHPARLLRLVRRALDATGLDLGGATVLTEAATGAYVVTPVLAALGGAARVVAVTRATRYGSVEDVRAETRALADAAGVADRIEVVEGLDEASVAAADILTNSGHVRPIDAAVVSLLRSDAVVPLMYEAWELDTHRGDLDVDALRARGIRTAGTNERHPSVDVFSFLGPMAVRQLSDAAVCARGAHVLVLCDNPFRDHLVDGLELVGARVGAHQHLPARMPPGLDAIVVALRPTGAAVLDAASVDRIARDAPGAVVVQFWGDLDRDALYRRGVPCWPTRAPATGHMGVLPSDVGPEPVVRLQAGGLKVGEVLRTAPDDRDPAAARYLDELPP
jgi:hypothetical protein